MTRHTEERPPGGDGERKARLKRRGITMLVPAVLALGWLADTGSGETPLLDRGAGELAVLALLFLAVANAAAIGGLSLYARLRTVPAAPDGARRGFWIKLLGANVLFVVFAFVNLHDAGAFGPDSQSSVAFLAVVGVSSVGLGWAGNLLLRTGAKHEALPAELALSLDDRPPVVYVRSFKDDRPHALPSGPRQLLSLLVGWTSMVSAEQEMARSLRRVGPVVAIGKPGERLPQLGASRVYVADDEWKARITGLMRDAALVVVRAGATGNLWWEIEQARALLAPERLILLSLGLPADRARFEYALQERFGKISRSPEPRKALGRILYFDQSWNLHAVAIRPRLHWLSIVMPMRAALDTAMQEVLRVLPLVAGGPSRPTVAVGSAMGG